MEAMAKSPYKLSRELYGHTADVRALEVGADGSIISGSRDKTAILWRHAEGNYVGNTVMTGHSNFVSSVCIINPSQKHPKGFIITGSNDNHICIYNLGEVQPIHKIKAHENTICALRCSNVDENSFLSSSWDISAKLWNLNSLEKAQVTYVGHSAAVWAVSDLGNGSVVTAGADKTVIVFLREGKVLHKLEGHTDCVRDITVISENEFLTCANDAVIKHWSALTGDCIGNYYGHTNYIYSISALPGGNLVVSSGEDRTIRVWCKGLIDQTITLPAQSVWCVRLLPNEDIVCGASDGTVRIFSSNPERHLDAETIQRFEEAVANMKINAEQEFNSKLNNLADSSSLSQPGKKDGETKLVKEEGSVKAYSWSQKELKWNLVGDVMSGNSNESGKQLYNGMEYDYVFSVDVQEGVPPLKLPYNSGQDPWHVAQKFIDNNNLSQSYLEQVANFIITNSTPAPVVNSASTFYDPFTGGNRYIPGSTTSQSVPPQPDPFTGGNRYVPSSTSTQSTQSTPQLDPFTGGNRYVPSSQSISQTAPTAQTGLANTPSLNTAQVQTFIPMTTYLSMPASNVTAIYDKLREINSKDDPEIRSIPEDKLESVMKLTTDKSQEAIESGALNLLSHLLSWPDAVVFPALDIARLAVLQRNVSNKICMDEIIHSVKRHLRKDALQPNQMLTFRLLANMFQYEPGVELNLRHKNEVLKYVFDLPALGTKNTQTALSTYILNLAVALNKTNDSAGKVQLLSGICSLLPLFKDQEAIFRVLVAICTLLKVAKDTERELLVSIVRESEHTLNLLQLTASRVEPTADKLVVVACKIMELTV